MEQSLKDAFLKEIEKYGIKDAEKTHIPFPKILHILEMKTFSGIIYLRLSDYSTEMKLDSGQEMYSYNGFFKTKYNVIGSLKTREDLFINFYGDDIEKEINIVMKDVESKIIYFFAEDELL
ncbi:hypothetical protein [Chryseobacterium tongliaoense]|uniref:hypothetical protein n=1 Tax=Chryseobacterium tongliaoense TaxID=3240933 RepID=UPI00351654DC